MSETSSLSFDSLPPARGDTDIEEEEIIFINVEQEIDEITRIKPKTTIGKSQKVFYRQCVHLWPMGRR